jgi:predicted nuclease of predicted toxin-antitoxin system
VTAPKMRFFIDQCAPESVAVTLERAGYEVARLREKIATNSPDSLVAAVAEANSAVLVTMDGDFKSIAARTGLGARRYRKLSLLRFERCRESQAASRLSDAMSLIEHEWAFGNARSDRRMFVVISAATIRTHR